MEFNYLFKDLSTTAHVRQSYISVFSPKIRLVLIWNFCFAFVAYVSVLLTLYEVFFDTTERFLWVIKYFLDALFILNIVSQFYIGYESQGVVIMDEKMVRNHYLHRWFILDVISILPIEVFALTHPEWNIWEVFPYWRLNRLFKTVQIFRFTTSLRKVPEFNKIHVANIYFFCVITLTLHVFSCFWYLVACTALHDEKTRNCGGKKSWPSLLRQDGGFMNNFSTFDAYVTSLYWAGITFTTVGYGDVYARNVSEIAVSVVLMCTGMILLSGFIMADMSSIITNLEARKGRFYTRLESIKLYLEDIGVADDIKSWISKYYSYMWHHRKGAVISGLLDDLPFTLHAEISVTAAKVLLKKAHLFDGTGDGFKRSLSMHIHPYTYSAGQILVRYGEVSRTMYYLKHGLVQVLGEDPEDKVATLLPGCLFGEINLVFRIPRNVTLCAATTCEIYLLHQDDLLSLFPDFPEDGEKVREAANTRLFNSIYPLKDAFNFGIASNPQSVVFHKNIADKLKIEDQHIFHSFVATAEGQLGKLPGAVMKTLEGSTKKVFWKKTIKPDSWFKKSWMLFYILCLVIGVTLETWVVLFTQVSEVPGFYSSPSRLLLILLAYIIDTIAIADIIITLRTQIISRDGNLSDLRSIFKSYKESWNVYFDVLAILPLEIFSFVHKHQVKSWNLLGLLRLNRLLWIRKIYMFFVSMENNPEKNLFLYRAMKSAFIVFFSIHFSGGIYYLSGCYYVSCNNGTWVDRMGLSISTEPQHYSKSIYWSAATLTSAGYGDVRAYTTLEKIICVTIGFLGVFVFNYFVSEIGATLASTNAAREAFQNRIRAVVQFMEAHELSESLQMRVIKYMCLLWNKYKGQAYPEGPFLMKDLSSELQQSVLMTERGHLLSRLPFFSEANPEFIQDLAFASVMYFYPKGEIIQYSDTVSRELFCIRKGICEILSEDLANIMGTFTPGMYFGELGFLFGKPSVVTVRAKTVCDILITDFERVQSILLKYPTLQKQLDSLQDNATYCKTLMKHVDNLVKEKLKRKNVFEEKVERKKQVLLQYQGRRYCKKSNCYVEDFGNFPIYAGMKEETVDERLRKTSRIKLIQHRPSSLKESVELFLLTTLPKIILMKNAILPSNPLYIRWEIFRIITAVFVCVGNSVLFAFAHTSITVWVICYFLQLISWIDIYVRLHVAFYQDNKLVVDTLETARNYARSSFLVDFTSCFPWEVSFLLFGSPRYEGQLLRNDKALHFYALLRTTHILQLYRIPLAFHYWQSGIATEKVSVTMFKFFIYMVLFIHLSACLCFAVVCNPRTDFKINRNETYTFPVTKHQCQPHSWVTTIASLYIISFNDATFYEVYSTCVYFAAATVFTVGYGDLHSASLRMDLLLTCLMVVGAVHFGWMVGVGTSILANANAARTSYSERVSSILHFLKSHNISGSIRNNILKYYDFKWIKTSGIDPETLFDYLPSSLLGDISTIVYADLITKAFGLNVAKKTQMKKYKISEKLTPTQRSLSGKLSGPILQETLSKESLTSLETDRGFIRLLSKQIRPCLFRAYDTIFKSNDYAEEMYFIDKGEVEVLSQDERQVMVTLTAGQYFGEGSLLFSEPQSATVRAATNCQLYVLTKKNFDEAMKYYPYILSEIKEAALVKQKEIQELKTKLLEQEMAEEQNKGADAKDSSLLKLCMQHMKEQAEMMEYKSLPLRVKLKKKFQQFARSLLPNLIRIHNFTINPEKPFRIILQYTSCFVNITSFLMLTYMPAVFNISNTVFLLSMIVEYLLILEIFLKFHMCYYDENGTYVYDYQAISSKYLKSRSGFIFDLVCSFPIEFPAWMAVKHKEYNTMGITMTNVRLLHCIRIIRIYLFIEDEKKVITNNILLIRVIVFALEIILFVHVCAVIYVKMECPNQCKPVGWYVSEDLQDYADIYSYALYWVAATFTTTGYGDVRATVPYEMWYTVLTIVLSKVIVGYNIGCISAALSNMNAKQVLYEEKLQIIKEYLDNEGIGGSLKQRVMHFFNYQWARSQGLDYNVVFSDTPNYMKTEIFSRVSVNLLKKQRAFRKVSHGFLRQLSTKMKLISYTTGEYISRSGDIGTDMFIILNGRAQLERNGTKMNMLGHGKSFGVIFLVERKMLKESVITRSYVDILSLSREDFEKVSSLFLQDKKKIIKSVSGMLISGKEQDLM
ncbi:uncharacterized protein LOC127529714 [Erpetoichthys calabaricus]|uniref:uncharacterized protein LOC127529714 n=1 Tax=Erpetoichthys calabaricus TaxID=27687 RepID=UPI00223435FB|nr:uncharacterized protein LOC127529714 [Erpetoichthys calabaricus]